MTTAAFSSSSEDVILRKVDNCEPESTPNKDLVDIYEINQCIEWLVKNCFTNVALQFPDQLLVDAPKISHFIQDALPNAYVFILGDTSYGR